MRLSSYYAGSQAQDDPGVNDLLLGADVHYAEVGTPVRYYWEWLVPAVDWAPLGLAIQGPGTSHADRWEWTPTSPGEQVIILSDSAGGHVSQTIVVEAPSTGGSLVTLINGDSNTAAAGQAYPAELRDRLVAAGVSVTMRGTRQGIPTPVAGVYHEGYPGRTYNWMLYGDPPTNAAPTNPYLYLAGSPNPNGNFDLGAYLTDNAGATPTLVGLVYGTNETGPATTGPFRQDIVDRVIALWEAIRAELPDAWIVVHMIINPMHDASQWAPSVGQPYTLSSWKANRHDINKRIKTALRGRYRTVHVSTHAAIAEANFVNGVHPNVTGHGEIADMAFPTYRRIARLAA